MTVVRELDERARGDGGGGDGAMTAEYMGERPSGATDVPLAMTTGHAIFS